MISAPKKEEKAKFGYTIKYRKEKWDIFWGYHTEFYIVFFDERASYVYQGRSSGKFFYTDNGYSRTYCKGIEDAASRLYRVLKNKEF